MLENRYETICESVWCNSCSHDQQPCTAVSNLTSIAASTPRLCKELQLQKKWGRQSQVRGVSSLSGQAQEICPASSFFRFMHLSFHYLLVLMKMILSSHLFPGPDEYTDQLQQHIRTVLNNKATGKNVVEYNG